MFAQRHTRARRPQSRRPLAESLENRFLLSGEVTVVPEGTETSPGQPTPTLEIIGDPADNQIMVRRGSRPDEIIVNGLNGTLVNGSQQELHYQGVEQILVVLNGGNDTFDGRNLTLSAEPGEIGDPFEGVSTAVVQVDGGAGDDRLTLFNTTINAIGLATPPSPETLIAPAASASVMLFGEASIDPFTGDLAPPSGTGNDFIEVSNTTIIADGGEMTGANLQIFGEVNVGGTITGGNDHINVSNTVIRATNTSFASSATATVEIHGDNNSAGGMNPSMSVIGEGNDWIDVNGTSIIADSAQGTGAVFVHVFGDSNTASGTGSATIGNFGAKTGGDDTISLTNTTVSASGANFSQNSVVVDIQGDQNFADMATATATVGSGNDTITVDNFDVNSSGTLSDQSAHLGIFGDGDNSATLLNFGRIGRGNDVIAVKNTDVTGTGTLNNSATLSLFSDDRTQTAETATAPGEGTRVGEGTDNVQLSNFLLGGSSAANIQLHTQKGNDVVDILASEFTGIGMSLGTGNDDLDILNSSWVSGNIDLDAGNDVVKMNGNSFVDTDVDGGANFDVLSAHNNIGTITARNFEEINGMPSPPLVFIVSG